MPLNELLKVYLKVNKEYIGHQYFNEIKCFLIQCNILYYST